MWAEYAAAFAAFFASHAVPVRPPVKPWLVARLGSRGFTAAYSGLSLAVLAWLIGAAGRAPHVPLWPWAPWQAWVPPLAMVAVCLIVALAVGRPNPVSFGGGDAARFDPARPGIVGWTRHPLLAALALGGVWMIALGRGHRRVDLELPETGVAQGLDGRAGARLRVVVRDEARPVGVHRPDPSGRLDGPINGPTPSGGRCAP